MFNNKIALVTGGTSGIGKEIVKQLLINGCNVIISFVKLLRLPSSIFNKIKKIFAMITLP
jgi:NAD(P)-dependent dehydrogenase (short-subunit alcohol dehydrogenase family)